MLADIWTTSQGPSSDKSDKSVPKSYFKTCCSVDIFAQTGKIFKQLRANTYIKLSLEFE